MITSPQSSQARTQPLFWGGQNFSAGEGQGGSRIILRGVKTQKSSKKHTKKGKISSWGGGASSCVRACTFSMYTTWMKAYCVH